MSQISYVPLKIDRRDLGKTISHCDLKQFVVLILFLIAILCDLFFIKVTFRLVFVPKWYYRLVFASPFFFFGILIAKHSLSVMYYEVRNPPVVIDWGPFRFSRHPMYFSALLIYLGLVIASFSIIGVILYGFVLSLYVYMARFEEKYLVHQFQETYVAYQKRVLKWIDFRWIFRK